MTLTRRAFLGVAGAALAALGVFFFFFYANNESGLRGPRAFRLNYPGGPEGLGLFLIGLVLFAVCLAGVWFTVRSQRNLTRLLSEEVACLQATQELQIRARQLRFRHFLNLVDPAHDVDRGCAVESGASE